jgi:hypothetical protein
MGVHRLFPLTHWHSCTLNGCSGSVQYSLTGIQARSQALRLCSVLTQMRTFSWSHHGESCSIMTQWRSCALIGHSHSLNGSHAYSMGVQGLFLLTWWSCTLNGCSGAVQYSLIEIHVNSQAFRGCSILTQRRSASSNTWKPNRYLFKHAKHTKAQYIWSQFTLNAFS